MSEVRQLKVGRNSFNPIPLDGIERCCDKTVSGVLATHIEAGRRKLIEARSNKGAEWGKKQLGMLREEMEKAQGLSFAHMGPKIEIPDFDYPTLPTARE